MNVTFRIDILVANSSPAPFNIAQPAVFWAIPLFEVLGEFEFDYGLIEMIVTRF